MDTLMQDIRFALRTLAKAPLFTTLCVLCLSIGIGLNANIYSAVYAVFQRPFPYADPDRLVAIEERNIKRGTDNDDAVRDVPGSPAADACVRSDGGRSRSVASQLPTATSRFASRVS